MKKLLRFTPILIFLLIFSLLWRGLKLNPHQLTSQLINERVPTFVLPNLYPQEATLSNKDFLGHYSLLNVWGSWCAACKKEHPLLMDLSRKASLPLYALNYKDSRENAMQILETYGNPFTKIGWDEEGKTSIEWGVSGTPETYLIDKKGIIRYKFFGALTVNDIENTLPKLLEQLEQNE